MFAYVFVNAEPGKIWRIADSAQKIAGVKMAHAVTGRFDVVIFGEFPSIDDISKVIEEVHSIKGVIKTHTAIVVPPRLDSEVYEHR